MLPLGRKLLAPESFLTGIFWTEVYGLDLGSHNEPLPFFPPQVR